jgi:hypothetical protein
MYMQCSDSPCYGDVSEFVARAFDSLPRADQRRWAEFYVRGLLETPGKKSIRKMAGGRLETSTTQSLQQFVNQSPWDWDPVRRKITESILRVTDPRALIIDRVVIPKRGAHSVGVSRRFVPELGRTMNSQVGVGLFLAGADYSVPIDRQIVLGGKWATDLGWRRKSRIPDGVAAGEEETTVLRLLDAHLPPCRLGVPPAPLLGDLCGSPRAEALLLSLSRRQVPFLLRVDGSQDVIAAPGRPPVPAPHGHRLTTLGALSQRLVRQQPLGILRQGGRDCSRLFSALIQLASPDVLQQTARPGAEAAAGPVAGRITGIQRLVVEQPLGRAEPPEYWLTNLPRPRLAGLPRLLELYRTHQKESAQLRTGFGVLDFEGRSYPGWHHHMTLVSTAFVYDRLFRKDPGGLPADPVLHRADLDMLAVCASGALSPAV